MSDSGQQSLPATQHQKEERRKKKKPLGYYRTIFRERLPKPDATFHVARIERSRNNEE